MAYQNLLTEIKENVLYIIINREKALNALNKQTLAELADVVAYASNTEEIKGIVLTGAGEKAFVAGADIKEFADYSGKQGEELARKGQDTVFNAIENSTKPFIAAINGFALGGGLELAMACHIRIASEHAKLGLPEVTLGLIPGYGGTQRLTQLVGKGKAIEMITTANMLSATEAEKIGLINYAVPHADLINKADELLNAIKQRAPLAVAAAIKAINAAVNDSNGYDIEIEQFGKCFETTDFTEGTKAFTEKRKPIFVGR